jgi:hypothetical protein
MRVMPHHSILRRACTRRPRGKVSPEQIDVKAVPTDDRMRTRSLHDVCAHDGDAAMSAQAINDSVVCGVKNFLDALNSSGRKPIEQLSPEEACQVLTDVHNSVQVNLSGVERSEKTIDFGGKRAIASHPEARRRSDNTARFHVLPWRRLGARRLPHT